MLTPDSILPPNDETWPRIRMTTSCTDCEAIPKVANAGQIIVQADQSQSYQLMHNGVCVIAGGYFDLWMAVIIQTLKGHHEPQEEKAFHEILKHISPNATLFGVIIRCGFKKRSPVRSIILSSLTHDEQPLARKISH